MPRHLIVNYSLCFLVLCFLFITCTIQPAFAKISMDEVCDFADWIEDSRMTDVDRLVGEYLVGIDGIEKADNSKKKTIKKTWKPHLNKLENQLLKGLDQAVLLLSQFPPTQPKIVSLHNRYMEVLTLSQTATKKMISAIKGNSDAAFNSGYKKLIKVVSLRNSLIKDVKELATIIIKQEGKEWLEKAKNMRIARDALVSEDFMAYIANPLLTNCDKEFQRIYNALAEIEQNSKEKKPTIKKTWKPHLNAIKNDFYPQLTIVHKKAKSIVSKTEKITSIHQNYLRAVSDLNKGLSWLIKGIKANSTSKFNMGYTLLTEAKQRQGQCANQLKALAENLKFKTKQSTSPTQLSPSKENLTSQNPPKQVSKEPKNMDQSVPKQGFSIQLSNNSPTLQISQSDFFLEGFPLPLQFARNYDSSNSSENELGKGWKHSFETHAWFDKIKNQIVIVGPLHQNLLLSKTEHPNLFRKIGGTETAILSETEITFTSADLLTWTYNQRGQLQNISNTLGQKLEFSYEQAHLSKIVGPWQQSLSFSYNSAGLLQNIKSSQGTESYFNYNEGNLLTEVIKDGELSEVYQYDDKHRIIKIQLAASLEWICHYGENQITLEDPFGIKKNIRETSKGDVKIIVQSIGETQHRTREFHPDGKIIDIDGEGGRTITETDSHSGFPIKITDPNGNSSQFKWDNFGRLISLTNPLQQTKFFTYLSNTTLLSSIKSLGEQTITMEYNQNFNLVKTTDSQKGKETTTWSDSGSLLSITGMNGSTTELVYNNHWLPQEIKVGKETILRFNFSETGKVVAVFSPVMTMDSPLQPATVKHQQLQNMFTTMLSTKAGQTWQNPEQNATCKLNSTGAISSINLSNGSSQKFVYDLNGRLVKHLIDEQIFCRYQYDPSGNLVIENLLNGLRCHHTYDSLHRLIESSWSDQQVVKYTYDEKNRIIESSDQNFTHTIKWDHWNRPVREQLDYKMGTSPFNITATNQYNDTTLTQILTVADQSLIYQKDPSGRLLSITVEPWGKFEFTWQENGQLLATTYPNGVATKFHNDEQGNHGITINNQDQETLFSLTAKRLHQQTISRIQDGRQEKYQFDASGQITKADLSNNIFTYSYDSFGNRKQVKNRDASIDATYHSNGQLAKTNTTSFTYDERMNLQSIKNSQGNQTTYHWNGPGQLTKVEIKRENSRQTLGYFYDEKGLLIAESVEGKITSTWFWNGLNPLLEMDGQGKVKKLFICGTAIDSYYAMVDFTKATHHHDAKISYIHRDERNNVSLLTDSQGHEEAAFVYSPFGQIQSQRGNTTFPFRFAGSRKMPFTNLYYMRARFYDAESGRFISPDPIPGSISDVKSLNPYIYAGNNPMDHIDPLGTAFWDSIKAMLPGGGKPAPAISETLATAEGTAVAATGDVVESLGNKYFPVIPKLQTTGSKITQQVVNGRRIVQAASDTIDRSAAAGRAVGGTYAVVSSSYNIYNAYQKVKSGEIPPEEGRRQIKGEVIGATISTIGGAVATGAKLATLPAAILVSYGANRTKDIAVAAMEAGDAKREALQTEKWADSVEVAAGMKKITAIKNAISNNQFKEAMRLNRDLLKYSQAHTDKNVDMYEMEAMTATLGTEIRKAREKQIELKEKEAQAYNEEMQNRIEAVKEKWADEENPGTKLSKEEQQQAKKEAKELALETKKAKMLEQKALLEAEKIKQASLQEEMKFQEELKRAAIEKDNKLKQEAIQTKHLQPRPIVQGSMSGNFKGSSSRGRISLTVNGKSVNGSFSGIYDDSKISGSVSGSYNPSTGKLKARLSGRWKFGSDSGSLAGSITGTQRGSGFSGTGQASGGGSDFGTWSVSGGQIIQPQGK